MGFGSTAVDAFFGICSTLALTVSTIAEWIAFAINLNYNIVTSIYTSVASALSTVFTVLDYIIQTIGVIVVYVFDFISEVYGCVVALFVLLWRICVLLYKVCCLLFTGVETVFLGIWSGGVLTYKAFHQSANDLADSCRSTSDYIAMLTSEAVAYVCNVFTSIGNFSTTVVRGIWYGIGYVPATIAYLPASIAQWLGQISTRCKLWFSYAFMNVTRETYVGIVVVCLLYVAVFRIFQLMRIRGMTLFSFSLNFRQPRQQRTRPNVNHLPFAFDREFESDVDIDDGSVSENDNVDDDDDDEDNESNDTGSEAHTELTLSDGSDSDGTVGSDSDVSLNSQTFSSEESDNEIDIQLPANAEVYSLRSRSSTPSRVSKDMNPEDFEREFERERDKRKCVVCQDQNKSVLLMPCRHMCLCVRCANQIVRSHFLERRICPLCRRRIERVMDVFV